MSYVAPGQPGGGYRTPRAEDPAAFHATHDPYDCVLQDQRGSADRCSHVYGPDPALWDQEAHAYMVRRTARWKAERGIL